MRPYALKQSWNPSSQCTTTRMLPWTRTQDLKIGPPSPPPAQRGRVVHPPNRDRPLGPAEPSAGYRAGGPNRTSTRMGGTALRGPGRAGQMNGVEVPRLDAATWSRWLVDCRLGQQTRTADSDSRLGPQTRTADSDNRLRQQTRTAAAYAGISPVHTLLKHWSNITRWEAGHTAPVTGPCR